ncbi:MAG: ATP-binding protein [Candidatus Kaelpia aquatica]|nr:ATP-binding protein [Candidatus Kaelpia aquatica]
MAEILTNPFTPQSGLEPRILGGREQLVKDFSSLLQKRKEREYFHLLLLGEWGRGKTSLLKYYKKISQNESCKAAYTSLAKSGPRDSYRDVLSSIVEEITFGLGLDIDLSSFQNRSKNAAISLVEALKSIFKGSNSQMLVVLVDDIQNISEMPKVLDLLRIALSNEDLIKETNILFVLASTPSGWTDFLKRYDPIGRFFRKKQILDKLPKDSLMATVKNTLNGTGVIFESSIMDNCWDYSEGHPYELQLLANHLYDNQIKGVVSKECWEVSLLNTLKDLGIEYFSSLYDKASEREKELLHIFAEKGDYLSLTQLKDIIIFEEKIKNYPVSNIKNFVYRLVDKNLILRRDDKKYRILDRMFAEYILRFR